MELQPVNPMILTPNEDAALQGLSWAAQILYLRGIRRYVNYRTSLAGSHDIRLSWQRFSVTLEVIRPSRSKKKAQEDRPSRQFIRERLKELEVAGLIVTKPNPKNLPFSIFFLPLTTVGQVRLAEEQPLIWGVEQPAIKPWLLPTNECGLQPQDQPPINSNEQPQNRAVNYSNVVGIKGATANLQPIGAQYDQPQMQPTQQPDSNSRLLSAKTCGVQPPQQPQKTTQEQPYIYSRIEEIEGRDDLDQQQKERILLLLKRLVSDERLHSLEKHFSEFLSLAIEHEMTFDELRDILNKITDEQFSIKLIKHQLINFVRKTKAKAPAVTKAIPTPKPKAAPTKPNNLEEMNVISSELTSLKRLIKHAPDNQALIDQEAKLEARLLELKQA